MTKVEKTLKRMLKLYNKMGHCKGSYFADKHNPELIVCTYKEATSCCIMGAAQIASGFVQNSSYSVEFDIYYETLRQLSRAVSLGYGPIVGLVEFNDNVETTKKDVVDVIKKAIDIL